jgi:chromosome segregation ATPase
MGYDCQPRIPRQVLEAITADQVPLPSATPPPSVSTTVEEAFGTLFATLSDDKGTVDLLGEIEALRQRVLERLRDVDKTRLEATQKEYAQCYADCRMRLDQVNDLTAQYNQLRAQVNALGERVLQYSSKVTEILAAKPHPSEYPTIQELREWAQHLEAARAELAPWVEKQRQAREEVQVVGLQLQKARQELDQAQAKEKTLRMQIEGKLPITSFGLKPPR